MRELTPEYRKLGPLLLAQWLCGLSLCGSMLPEGRNREEEEEEEEEANAGSRQK